MNENHYFCLKTLFITLHGPMYGTSEKGNKRLIIWHTDIRPYTLFSSRDRERCRKKQLKIAQIEGCIDKFPQLI